MAGSSLLTGFIMPLAVLVSATATTTTAVFAWRLYRMVTVHERALFGDQNLDDHDGILTAVNENTERSERNRRILKANDLVTREQTDFLRGGQDKSD